MEDCSRVDGSQTSWLEEGAVEPQPRPREYIHSRGGGSSTCAALAMDHGPWTNFQFARHLFVWTPYVQTPVMLGMAPWVLGLTPSMVGIEFSIDRGRLAFGRGGCSSPYVARSMGTLPEDNVPEHRKRGQAAASVVFHCVQWDVICSSGRSSGKWLLRVLRWMLRLLRIP